MMDDNTKSFIRFCVVGCGNTLIDFGIFMILYYGAGVALVPAHVVAVLVATLNSYLLNKFWTYGDTSPHNARQVLRFLAVSGVALAANTGVIYACALVMPAVMAKVCAIGVTLAINYGGTRFFVFLQRETRR